MEEEVARYGRWRSPSKDSEKARYGRWRSPSKDSEKEAQLEEEEEEEEEEEQERKKGGGDDDDDHGDDGVTDLDAIGRPSATPAAAAVMAAVAPRPSAIPAAAAVTAAAAPRPSATPAAAAAIPTAAAVGASGAQAATTSCKRMMEAPEDGRKSKRAVLSSLPPLNTPPAGDAQPSPATPPEALAAARAGGGSVNTGGDGGCEEVDARLARGSVASRWMRKGFGKQGMRVGGGACEKGAGVCADDPAASATDSRGTGGRVTGKSKDNIQDVGQGERNDTGGGKGKGVPATAAPLDSLTYGATAYRTALGAGFDPASLRRGEARWAKYRRQGNRMSRSGRSQAS